MYTFSVLKYIKTSALFRDQHYYRSPAIDLTHDTLYNQQALNILVLELVYSKKLEHYHRC